MNSHENLNCREGILMAKTLFGRLLPSAAHPARVPSGREGGSSSLMNSGPGVITDPERKKRIRSFHREFYFAVNIPKEWPSQGHVKETKKRLLQNNGPNN